MNKKPRDWAKRFRIQGSGGFSLIEMTVAVAVAVVIGMGLYAIFNSQLRSSRAQKTYNDLQTNCSFALDSIKNDLLLAGYQAINGETPISAAGSGGITFEFMDENAQLITSADDPSPADWTNNTQVSYALADDPLIPGQKILQKTVLRYKAGLGYQVPFNWSGKNSFTLAKHIQALNFQYLAQDNATLAAPGTVTDDLKQIRSVRVTLACQAEVENAIFKNPQLGGADQYQTITLTAEVRPRNIAVSSNPDDKTPPAVPTGLKIWDEGFCGCLQVKWNSNTDSDIAGYTLYYGLAAGAYINRARVVHNSGTEQRYTLQNLTSTNTPYFIAISAFDNSGNHSGLSTEISANPGTSVRTEGAAGNDTTITPLPPPAPGGLTVATPEDNKLLVSWTKTYTDCMTTPVFGYRLYRGDYATFTPDGTSKDVGNCIADESELKADKTSYLDDGGATKLTGCFPYYYKLAVVTCDPAQLSNYTNPGMGTTTTYTEAEFASISGTPTDGTAPPAPNLNSTPGFSRIRLELVNPTVNIAAGLNVDFTFTRIYFSRSGYPVLTETRDAEGYNIINGGDLIPDNSGAFSGGGSRPGINFDSENSAIPSGGLGQPELVENATYYFLAVAYDRCKNHSQVSDEAKSVAGLCKDGLVGELWRDAPPAPENLRVTQGCSGSPLRLDWDYTASNYTAHPDFEGFRVLRRDGPSFVGGTNEVDLSGTTLIWNLFWEDNTVTDGKVYSYRVEAGDCYYRKYLEGLLTAADIAANDPSNNKSWSDKTGLALGGFDRAHVVGDVQTHLTAAIGPWDSTIPVASTTGFTRKRFQIDAEVIECNSVTPTSFTDCWFRGAVGFPIGHLAGTYVSSYPPAPPRAAVSGDLTLSPPTFRHNIVTLGAKNTMDDTALPADSLTLTRLDLSWETVAAYLKQLLYGSPAASIFTDTGSPLTKSHAGSTISLSVPVAATANNVPLSFKYLKSDGTLDAEVDLREDQLSPTWRWRNNTTEIDTCSRAWSPRVAVPLGPVVSGTTQSAPTWGTVAWPVPGVNNNPMNAIVVPSGSWLQIYTNVHDSSGEGIASVRLYYRAEPAGAGELTSPPAPTGTYPALTNYTMVTMTQLGSETWWGHFPQWPLTPDSLNNKNIWYFIVATDNEGNFDREPEIDRGAFQFYQQASDPCLNTPRPPLVTGSLAGSTVTLDWSGSFSPDYWNTNGSVCTDLANFKVFYQKGSGAGWQELAELGPTTKTYPHVYTTHTTSLTSVIDAAVTTIPATTTDFDATGKIAIDGEVISYTGTTAASFTGCTRGQNATVATDHAAGAAVTQNNLTLETNSYFVRASDSCNTGAKYSDSLVYTEGSCSPACYFSVSSAMGTSSISAGDPIYIDVYACDKVGGAQETIYVQACSGADTDAVPIVESSAGSGSFSITLNTSTTDAGDSPTVLKVGTNDTVTIGGYAASAGTWETTCAGSGYSCGSTKTITVAPAVADPCASSHTPNTPGSLSYTLVGSCKSEAGAPNNTKQLTLSWPKVTPPDAGYTSFGYKLYYCDTAGCTPSLAKAFTYTCDATTCTSATVEMPSQLKGTVYTFGVSSYYEINNCPSLPTVRGWESLTTVTKTETCTN